MSKLVKCSLTACKTKLVNNWRVHSWGYSLYIWCSKQLEWWGCIEFIVVGLAEIWFVKYLLLAPVEFVHQHNVNSTILTSLVESIKKGSLDKNLMFSCNYMRITNT